MELFSPGYFTLGRRLAPPAFGIPQARLSSGCYPGRLGYLSQGTTPLPHQLVSQRRTMYKVVLCSGQSKDSRSGQDNGAHLFGFNVAEHHGGKSLDLSNAILPCVLANVRVSPRRPSVVASSFAIFDKISYHELLKNSR